MYFSFFFLVCVIVVYVQVIIAEGAAGEAAGAAATFANALYELANVSITVIPDSNIFAIMSRVNKVCMHACF